MGTSAIVTPAAQAASGGGVQPKTQTIVVQQSPQPTQQPSTIHLPNTPVPKEQLNLNGSPQIINPVAPLNPATIPLPPSVANALQSINEKVVAKQRAAAAKQIVPPPVSPPPQIIKQEVTLTQAAGEGSPPSGGGGGGGAGGNSPLFYYFMPGSVPYNLDSSGGATVQVATRDGSVTTAQLVSVPASSVQGGNSATATASGGNSTGWVLEGGSSKM